MLLITIPNRKNNLKKTKRKMLNKIRKKDKIKMMFRKKLLMIKMLKVKKKRSNNKEHCSIKS